MTSVDDELDHFIEHVRLLLNGQTMEGLGAWAKRFAELRQISEFALCKRLANAVRTADLPQHGIGVVRYGEGWLYDRMGQWQDAIKAYEASRVAFQDSAVGTALETILLNQIGSLYQDQGEWGLASSAYLRALEAAGEDHQRALVLNNLAGLHLLSGQHEEADSCYRHARDLLRDRDARNYAAATHGLATVMREQGHLQQSQDLDIECLQIFQSANDMGGVAAAIGGIATSQLYARRYPEAVHNYDIALTIFLETNDHIGLTRTHSNLSIAWQAMGDLTKALEHLHHAIAGYRDLGDRHGEAAAQVNLARLNHSAGDVAAALIAAETARAVCEQFGHADELQRLPADLA